MPFPTYGVPYHSFQLSPFLTNYHGPNSPETLPTSVNILDGACAYPSPQLLTGIILAPRADTFNNALHPPLPQMRDGGAPAFLCRELVTSASLLTSAPHHPLPRPSPCVLSLTLCLRPILVPLPLRQFPRPLCVASIPQPLLCNDAPTPCARICVTTPLTSNTSRGASFFSL